MVKIILFAVQFFGLYAVIANCQTKKHITAGQIAVIDDNKHLNYVLSNILIPRVVGSPGHSKVMQFIKSELESFGFRTEIDRFTTPTPLFGNLTFSNIIGTFNPNAEEFLTLACHFDSKYFPNDLNFVGAIDSAVPCSLMLNIAKTLQPYLENNVKGRPDIGLMLIFFDGEEAFLDWNEYDSLYGSRHLARKLSKKVVQVGATNREIRDVDRIEVLVLLDLMGAANSKFYSFYENTNGLHRKLHSIERNLAKANLLEGSNSFQIMRGFAAGYVDDDHKPFLKENVPVLHLIATPFPEQWHQPTDTAENLSFPSIRNLNRILRIFTYEYLTNHSKKFQFRSL